MGSVAPRSADPTDSASRERLLRAALREPRAPRARAPIVAMLLAVVLPPAVGFAHERWIPHTPRFPVNRGYFQSMSGEVLAFSLAATVAILGLIVFWYLTAPGLAEALDVSTPGAVAREQRRNVFARGARGLVRFLLDGDSARGFMTVGLKVATFFFARVPALVLALGAYQGWLVMPSYPLDDGPLGTALRVVEVVLAIWIAIGLFLRPLGGILFAVYVYLCIAYGVAGVDAVPVLASAFFYLFAKKGESVTSRQLLGMRVSLGFGFFLLGLVNKILLGPELFVGVGDQHPALLMGPQAMFPGLTREAWCFTTALGEMVFGLLLLIGIFNRVTTLVLTLVFANFVLVFGLAEIVHIYPIAGFLLLFFRGPFGTALDGVVFRANVGFWRRWRHTSIRGLYIAAVTTVAAFTASLLMFLPLLLITEVIPAAAGIDVPANYKAPPPPPPAAMWSAMPSASAPSSPLQPHADHEPRHGGLVTMTGDNHVEIVVRRDGAVQLFISNAVRAPIDPREVSGLVRLERTHQSVALAPDAAGALAGLGAPPTVATDYTYVLKIRGVPSTQTIRVPAGGTVARFH